MSFDCPCRCKCFGDCYSAEIEDGDICGDCECHNPPEWKEAIEGN